MPGNGLGCLTLSENGVAGALTPIRSQGRAIAPYAFVLRSGSISIFMFWPLARQLWMSLTDTQLTNPTAGNFIGLKTTNGFSPIQASYISLKVTLIYARVVLLGVTIGSDPAVAIDRPFRGRPIARAILLFGWACRTSPLAHLALDVQ